MSRPAHDGLMTNSTPGARLRTARKRARLTQQAVADLAGVSQPAISEFESGENDEILASNLVRICQAVGVTVEYVITGTRSAQDDIEAEAIALLRGADRTEREIAMRSLRGILTKESRPSAKQQARRA